MPIKVTGVKGLSIALKEYAEKLQKDIPERTITPIARETQSRLQQDTPVITGQLRASTTLRKDSATKQTLGQSAPYTAIVESRRGYWAGAVDTSEKWVQYYQKTVKDEWQVMIRKYAGQ
jgi:hypothetical protein